MVLLNERNKRPSIKLFVLIVCFISSSTGFTVTTFLSKNQLSTSTRSSSTIPLDSTSSSNNDIHDDIGSSISALLLKKELLSVIPKRPFQAPATNVTIDSETIATIERVASALEYLTPLPPLTRSQRALDTLDGGWQLIYSDASEITRIAKPLPLGFCLGPVFQPIDVKDGRLENQALIKHRLLLFSGHTRVGADFSLAPEGEVNRVGRMNVGERVNVKFSKVIFSLRRFLILPIFGKIRKTAIPKGPAAKQGILPSVDITYLDDDMRISRGGDGSLFILVRAGKGSENNIYKSSKKMMPMLPSDFMKQTTVKDETPTYDASVDILPKQ